MMRSTALSTLAVASLAITTGASAQITTWTGAVSTSWNDAANWDNGVPNLVSETAIIGAPSPTLGNINVTLGGLTVLADGQLDVGAGRNFDFGATATISNAGAINIAPNTDFQLINTVTNDGTITLDGSGAAADLELDAAAAIAGSGEIVLNGSNARINDFDGASLELTNGVDHTIRGSGQIGVNQISVINQGLILADVSGETLTLDPATLFTNNATLRAQNGGTLAIGNGPYINTGGVIESVGGQVRFDSAAVVTGGAVTGADVAVTGGVNVDFIDVTFDATVAVAPNTDFGVSGTITNNGAITIDGSGPANDIELQDATTFTGSGTVILDGVNARINDFNSASLPLTNGADHTIRGSGNIGGNQISVVNEGLILADVSGGTLTLDPSAVFTNNATLRAQNGGTLAIGNGFYINTGGAIESDGGQVRFDSAAVVTGGTVTGSDVAVSGGANVEFIDVSFDATVAVATNTDFGVSGTITNNGTITIDGSGPANDIELQDATTFAGTGTVILDGANARINDFDGASLPLTNGADHTIRGSGNIGGNQISIINEGLILADGQTLTIDPAQTFDNDGIVRAVSGGAVQLVTGTYNNSDGLVEAIGDGSRVESTSSGAVFLGVGSIRAIDGGAVEIFDTSTFDFDATSNAGLIELRGLTSDTDVFRDSGIPSGGASFGAGGPGAARSRALVSNTGTIRLGGGFTLYSGGFAADQRNFFNEGTIVVESGSEFAGARSNGFIQNVDGNLTEVITQLGTFFSTGTLAGSGTIANTNTLFNVTTNGSDGDNDFIDSDGVIAPGDNPGETGELTLLARDVILGDANDIQIDIGALGGDSVVFDTLAGNTVELNGELSVSLLPGYAPSGGDSFVILTAAEGFTGTFDTEDMPTLGGGVSLSLDYAAMTVTLSVDGVVGDYNGDGFVDAADYTVWRDTLGSTTDLSADGDLSGVVDQADYDAWRGNFGNSAASSAINASAVPEPTTLVVFSLGGVLSLLATSRGTVAHRIRVIKAVVDHERIGDCPLPSQLHRT